MTEQTSRTVETNQTGPHERLEEVVRRHLDTPSRRPVAAHTAEAYQALSSKLATVASPLILDACCGVGDSTRNLARAFPDHFVIGVDKSANRLTRERAEGDPENMVLVRADLNDFYRLAVADGLAFDRHYIFYPNPWPKAAHLARRWHGASVFAGIVKIKGILELRSNWKLYLEEFQIALKIAGIHSDIAPFVPDAPITPFEAKYHASGQQLWQLTAAI